MTTPERPPISGLTENSVRMDLTKPKGVFVDVNGALSADLGVGVLEEVCQRGGSGPTGEGLKRNSVVLAFSISNVQVCLLVVATGTYWEG